MSHIPFLDLTLLTTHQLDTFIFGILFSDWASLLRFVRYARCLLLIMLLQSSSRADVLLQLEWHIDGESKSPSSSRWSLDGWIALMALISNQHLVPQWGHSGNGPRKNSREVENSRLKNRSNRCFAWLQEANEQYKLYSSYSKGVASCSSRCVTHVLETKMLNVLGRWIHLILFSWFHCES